MENRSSHGPPFILIVVMISTALCSCSRDVAFVKAYSSVDRSGGIDKLLLALVSLDQQYPDRFKLKHEIGMLMLQRGDPLSAEPFLKRAESLAGRRINPSERATLLGGLAIVFYARGEYAQAVDYGKKALSVRTDEADVFGFITARALLGEGKSEEAIEYFDAAWRKARASMTREDYRAYAHELASAERYADLVSVLDSYESCYPYEPGLGLMQSEACERLGDFDGAVLAAFKEAEYGAAYGAAKPLEIQKNLANLGRKLEDKTFNPEGKGKTALLAISAFAKKDWQTALTVLESRRGAQIFEKYLLLSTRIELKRTTSADVEAFAALMPSLRSLPPYFYRLYLGLKGLPGTSADRLADVLETAINLAPGCEQAQGYRKELAGVLGLSTADGARIQTRAELSSAAEKAATSGELAFLDPLIATLDLKDNRSTLLAVGILRAFAKESRYRPYIIDKSRLSAGRARERLNYILAH
jgi:tetratricopeptide (TPR) repeat protein